MCFPVTLTLTLLQLFLLSLSFLLTLKVKVREPCQGMSHRQDLMWTTPFPLRKKINRSKIKLDQVQKKASGLSRMET